MKKVKKNRLKKKDENKNGKVKKIKKIKKNRKKLSNKKEPPKKKKIQSDLIANSNEISPKEINKISRNTKKIGNNSSLDSKLNLNNSKNKTILVKLKKNTKIHNNNSIINIYPRIQIRSKNNKQATQFQTNINQKLSKAKLKK